MHGEPVASAMHVRVASPLLTLIAVLGGVLGAVLLVGGLYLAFADKLANTKFQLFGNDFSSTSVGVSMAFIGAVLVVLVFRRVLSSVEHLAGLPAERQDRHLGGGGGGGGGGAGGAGA